MPASRSPRRTGRRQSVVPAVSSVEWTLLGVVALAAIGAWRGTLERFYLLRATGIAVVALALVAMWLTRLVSNREVHMPSRPVLLAIFAFSLAVAVAITRGGDVVSGLLGPYARYIGGAPYLAYAVLFITAASVFDLRSAHRLALTTIAGLATVVAYGLLQVAGLDPFEWGGEYSTTFSTMGQVNFAAGWTAIALPFAAWGALETAHDRRLRIASAVVMVGAVSYLPWTGSFQGPVAAAVGLGAVGASWLVSTDWPSSWKRRFAIAGAIGLAAAVGTLRAPLAAQLSGGLEERTQLWRAALKMIEDSPVFGRGFGGYARDFMRFRPVEHVPLGGLAGADDPHNVLLNSMVSGGTLLLVVHVALFVVIGTRLVQGWIRAEDARSRLLVASFGGGWLAYLTQAMVSFDVPAVAVMNFVIGGAIVGVSESTTRPAVPVAKKGRPGSLPPRRRPVEWSAAILVLASLVPVTRPLRADMAAADAAGFARAGDLARSAQALDKATRLAPWEATYWAAKANVEKQQGDLRAAIRSGAEAALRNPGAPSYALSEARLAQAAGDLPTAKRFFLLAAQNDPANASTLVAAARFLLQINELSEAESLIERSVALDPRSAVAWAARGELAELRRDPVRARRHFERALSLDPSQQDALAGLERVAPSKGP